MLKDLVLRNRSYRRFDETTVVSRDTLVELVELARLSPSAANRQPLRFILSAAPDFNHKIFPCLRWAGYLTDWAGPQPGERPTAYIVILKDKRIAGSETPDHGIAAQSMMLGAVEKGLGGCMIGSIDRDALRMVLGVQDHFEIVLVLALGKPGETVVVEEVREGNIKYWRDTDGVHHVPKRAIRDLILGD